MNLKDAILPLGMGALIGIGLNMFMKPQVASAMEADVSAEPTNAEGEVDLTLGQQPASEGYNTSEVWDFRDRVYKNDNVLSNKLPFINLTPTGEWDPNNPRFIGSRDFDCVS